MHSQRSLFFKHLAQTSPFPPALEIVRAEGCNLYDAEGKKYLDLISGISVSSFGHANEKINEAIHQQVDKHLHLMVYGEYIVSPQVELVTALCKLLPPTLQSVYLTNSGTEATEGAMKLAKRFTGRTGFISFRNAYHGSTQGALSICGNESLKNAYRPLLPDHRILDIDREDQFEFIDENTAAVFIEPIQAEAGIRIPQKSFLEKLRKRCTEKKVLLVFDEIQTGMGRTGSLFAFNQIDVVPDILLAGKALGGGMPLGAFISSQEIMSVLSNNPMLGHLTTSGGHAVSCAASLAALKILTTSSLLKNVAEKEKLFRSLLIHSAFKEIRGKGLLLAIEFDNEMTAQKIISRCFENGLLTDWFLFAPSCMRIAPPLIISEEEIRMASKTILECSENL
jgi:acetylornithine/succinyldiaminopimelate/putrescine aminotransferase